MRAGEGAEAEAPPLEDEPFDEPLVDDEDAVLASAAAAAGAGVSAAFAVTTVAVEAAAKAAGAEAATGGSATASPTGSPAAASISNERASIGPISSCNARPRTAANVACCTE